MMMSMATEPAIGTRIKRARERKRWTQKRLADEIGVSQKTIDNWENGRTEPKSSIGALEEVLGVRLDAEPEEPEMPTPEELERLVDHIHEVLADRPAVAAQMEDALRKTVAGEPPSGAARGPRKASPGDRSGYGAADRRTS